MYTKCVSYKRYIKEFHRTHISHMFSNARWTKMYDVDVELVAFARHFKHRICFGPPFSKVFVKTKSDP